MKNFLTGLITFGILWGPGSIAGETINGAGATFPYPLYAAWAYQYYKETGIKVNYQSIGSGGGKLDKLKLYQWPQVIGGEVLAINIPGVKSEQMVLDSDAVCHIFLGNIKYWDDPKIKKLNPKLKLPHKKITVVHRSDGSGTTAVFTHYLDEVCPDWHKKVGFGKAVKWPVGIGADPKKHFYTWITNTPGPDAWPIVAATNILVAREKPEVAKKVTKFFNWAFSKKGDEIAKRLVYAPLPEELKKKIRSYWKKHGIYPVD